jgi:hypothetical protein
MLLGAGVTFVATRYHVVRYQEGVMLVSRSQQPPLRSSYVDIRDWGAAMWKQYPEVATALANGGHSQLIAAGVAEDLRKQAGQTIGESDADDSLEDLSSLRVKSTSSLRKPPIVPIRLQPADEPATPPDVDLGGSTTSPRKSVTVDKAVSSALESLFAPYEQNQAAPAEIGEGAIAAAMKSGHSEPVKDIPVQPASTSIPKPTDATAPALMELKSLDIELGEPVKFAPAATPPRQAESAVPEDRTRSTPIDLGRLEQAEPL